MFCYGMSNDDVVAGVVVFLFFVEMESGICISDISAKGKELYVEVVLDSEQYIICCLPLFGQQSFVIEVDYQFPHCLKTCKELIIPVRQQFTDFSAHIVCIGQQVNYHTGVKKQPHSS